MLMYQMRPESTAAEARCSSPGVRRTAARTTELIPSAPMRMSPEKVCPSAVVSVAFSTSAGR